jgi:folate-binding protein YgfZ
MVSDLNIYALANELLLDFEPGYTQKVRERLEHFIIAEEVQVEEVAPLYGLLSIQGPKAREVVEALGFAVPVERMKVVWMGGAEGESERYLVNNPRLNRTGFDLYLPAAEMPATAARLQDLASWHQGRFCGWNAFELARVEAGIPRFGADMDETTLPPEAGLEARAISYKKGCYIGQEVLSRIRTYGQVAKSLRLLALPERLAALPKKGDKLTAGGKEVGMITSAAASPARGTNMALGYVRREANALGTELTVESAAGPIVARIVEVAKA